MKVYFLFFLLYKALWLQSESTLLTDCPLTNVKTSFLQLYQDHQNFTSQDWLTLLKQAHDLGINHIIIQWSSDSNSVFYPVNPLTNQPSDTILFKIISAAKQEQLTISMGLNYNQQFWQVLNGKDEELKRFLDTNYQKQQALLPFLINLIKTADPNNNTVIGWYITEEIDDLSWQSENRRELLKNYLNSLTQLLKQQKPNWPISISTYASGQANQEQIVTLYQFLFNKTSVNRFLMQSSIGTKKLTLAKLKDYLQIITNVLQGSKRQFAVIIELFIEDSKQKVFLSAPLDLVLGQLVLANQYSTINPVVFSLFSYVLPNKTIDNSTLYTFWQTEHERCKSLFSLIIPHSKGY
ncbi:Uncharacterised protein [Legionella busanensis]|uniref:DUF4434 domain-containing protein n=1 Tax=Legionella busanensis TaxID=190655 RepID=A0A378JP19_9GAMM|nr:DUF4434 domain-containing protein [Legionella busanensis]STX52428.1 Uncharacterised protein [Legionella busanensis]